jgi:WD40 repeat protein
MMRSDLRSIFRNSWTCLLGASLVIAAVPALFANDDNAKTAKADAPISYYQHIRPILQAQCQGCHQPAKAGGDYVMTTFDNLLAGGQSGQRAVVPGDPAKSHLIEQITPQNGKVAMPQGKSPLTDQEIGLIKRWIAAGATDDTPANARARYDLDHPPQYTRPPVIPSIDFSPDGKLLAVAGFHEVLLTDPSQGKLVGRLIGLSERIQSVKFAPNGELLAAAGGNPGRMGELQIWNVAKKKLRISIPVGFDTVYGVSWSPDGKSVAVGCPDNNVRAFDAKSGAQVLQQGAHSDWVLDTVFSKDGKHLVSVGRDMTAKLTEVATQRFIDNITSITPGALKGGIQAVDRHPQRDEIVMGGSDGTPKVYRMFRETARKIGDDANLIRKFPEMKGRVFSVAISRDGQRVAAGSALDNRGQIFVYAYAEDPKTLQQIKAIESRPVKERKPEDKAELEKLRASQPSELVKVEVPGAGVYAVAFRPDAKVLAAAGSDGTVRLMDTANGKVLKTYSPAPVVNTSPVALTA